MYRKERNAYWMWKSSWDAGSAAEAKRPGALPDVLLDLPRSAAPVKRPLVCRPGVRKQHWVEPGGQAPFFFLTSFLFLSFFIQPREGSFVLQAKPTHGCLCLIQWAEGTWTSSRSQQSWKSEGQQMFVE